MCELLLAGDLPQEFSLATTWSCPDWSAPIKAPQEKPANIIGVYFKSIPAE
jgi:hypothetical protein